MMRQAVKVDNMDAIPPLRQACDIATRDEKMAEIKVLVKQPMVVQQTGKAGDFDDQATFPTLECAWVELTMSERNGLVQRQHIVQFLDRFNFCIASVKRSCIHFVTPELQLIPFDTYNLFYRNGLVDKFRKGVARGAPVTA